MKEVPMSVLLLLGLLTATCQPSARAPRTQPVSAVEAPPPSTPKNKADVRELYEAGKYQDVVKSVSKVKVSKAEEPELQYLAAQSYQKLGQWDDVRKIYGQLAKRGTKDAWRYIGQSGEALVNKKTGDAVKLAQKAVKISPGNAHAQYQLGMAESVVPDFAKAAAAFKKAALVDPTFAYAHYYAAMSYYKLKRIDLMATHFEAFLKLAPNAPERPQVESIMRTVRGGN
jgi:tetratricopeptide (TPR) repeat protein